MKILENVDIGKGEIGVKKYKENILPMDTVLLFTLEWRKTKFL